MRPPRQRHLPRSGLDEPREGARRRSLSCPAALAAVLVAAATLAPGGPSDAQEPDAPVAVGPEASGPEADAPLSATPIATGLAFPAAFTVAPDGRIFYGERFTGRIRILDPVTSSDALFYAIPNVVTDGERGLLGLALHPEYPARPFVYAFVSRDVGGGPESHVLRLRDSGGQGTAPRLLFSDDSGQHHNGSRVVFGPDGRLYVSIGDRGAAGTVQNLASNAGKILRMTANGSLPADNPITGSYVFAKGFRNPFGVTFDPLTGRVWSTDNGPECNDELNRVRPAGNYAWGRNATCETPPPAPRNTNQDGADPILPRAFHVSSVAPTGLAFCSGCGLGAEEEGRLFYGTFVTRQIRRVQLTANRFGIAFDEVAYTHPSAVLAVETAPNGRIFFSTTDGIFRLASP